MSVIRLQNGSGDSNVHYEFDPTQVPLGEGGMGRVFRGLQIDESNGLIRTRAVAIKLLFDDLPEHAIKRSRREASVRIKNDNLVEMIDFVEDHDSITHSVHYHVVSEFLNGVSLDEMLEGKTTNHDGSHNPTAERLLNAYRNRRKAFAGEVFRSILSGIMALHDAGYIHRDIDPSNIMVTSEGKIKLIDFGIAKKVNELGTNDKQLTSAGQFVGKTYYAAPELLLGDLQHQNRTTDIYSLGITLFQLLTGHLPFDGAFQEVYEKQLHEKLPLKEVEDKTVRRIIEKATEKDQRKRYQSASEFRVDIDNWMASSTENDGNKRVTLDISIPKSNPMYKKIALVAASIAVIGVSSYFIAKAIPHGTEPNPTPSNIVETPPNPEPEEEELIPMKELSADYGKELVMEGNRAEGMEMLGNLADNGDCKAAFLMSRICFDRSKAKGGTEFDGQWDNLRAKSGKELNNDTAHAYLMKAYRTEAGKTDPAVLYELGCDFMYDGRGAEKDFGKARTCFEAVDSVAEEGSPYKNAIKDKKARTQQKPSKPIE